jgi:hypothetical protein
MKDTTAAIEAINNDDLNALKELGVTKVTRWLRRTPAAVSM